MKHSSRRKDRCSKEFTINRLMPHGGKVLKCTLPQHSSYLCQQYTDGVETLICHVNMRSAAAYLHDTSRFWFWQRGTSFDLDGAEHAAKKALTTSFERGLKLMM